MEQKVVPVITITRCNGCGLCTEVCTCGSLSIVDGVAVYRNGNRCAGCNRWCCQCEMVCPAGAITCPFEVVIESD